MTDRCLPSPLLLLASCSLGVSPLPYAILPRHIPRHPHRTVTRNTQRERCEPPRSNPLLRTSLCRCFVSSPDPLVLWPPSRVNGKTRTRAREKEMEKEWRRGEREKGDGKSNEGGGRVEVGKGDGVEGKRDFYEQAKMLLLFLFCSSSLREISPSFHAGVITVSFLRRLLQLRFFFFSSPFHFSRYFVSYRPPASFAVRCEANECH